MQNRFFADNDPPRLPHTVAGGSDAALRLIADAMPQIVWIADADGRFEFCNQAWHEFSGIVPDGPLEQCIESVLHPDDSDRCQAIWRDAVKNATVFEIECRFRRASDGAYRWHLVRAHTLKDETGAVAKWIGSSTDINDQKDAQRALRDSIEDVERQVRDRTAELQTTNMQLLEAISERRRAAAIHEQDTQRLNDIIATQAMLMQAGMTLRSFLDLAARKVHRLTGATGTVVELIEGNEVVSAAATGSTAPFIGFRKNIAGSLSGLCIRKRQILKCDNALTDPRVDAEACLKVGAVSLVVAPLYDKGEAIGVLKILSTQPAAFGQRDMQTLELMAGLLGAAIAQQVQIHSNERLLAERTNAVSALQSEIDNRLRSELRLQQAERRIRILLERSHDAFFCMDGEGVIVDWNKQAESMFGWPSKDAMGSQFAALMLPEEARAGLDAQIRMIANADESTLINKRIEMTALQPDGRTIPVELLLFPVREDDARVVNVFVRDIGRQKQIEEKIIPNEKRLRTIADNLPAWIAYLDANQRYCFANAYYATESGIDPADLIGHALIDVVGSRRYADMKERLDEVMRGSEVRYERTIKSNRGAMRQKVHYIPDIAKDGTVSGFFSIVTRIGDYEEIDEAASH